MDIPVYRHTIEHLKAVIDKGDYSLQAISDLIRYDPGLYLSVIRDVNLIRKDSEITSLSHALSFIGAEGIENLIRKPAALLGDEHMLLWCYSVIAREASARINEIADITGQEDAFFAGLLSAIGVLLMIGKYPNYKKITELMLKLSLKDKLFIENRLFRTNQLQELSSNITSPELYSNLIDLLNGIFGNDRQHQFAYPPRLSMASRSYQLMQLMNISEMAARLILFPSTVEAQENFRELAVRYFRIPETDAEALLADIEERFEGACEEFGMKELSERLISETQECHNRDVKFLTRSETFMESLKAINKDNQEGRNIFIHGGTGVGKRLLALYLHHHDNPRQGKPSLAVFCGTLDSETLEAELFGVRDGFLGMEEQRGLLDIANGGTIILKDIDKIPLDLQDKLAEVFHSGKYYRLGDIHPSYFDIRIICASHKNIFAEAKERRFSKKFLQVLNPAPIYIPPLRERREDIEFIADSIIKKYNLRLTDRALKLSMQEYFETYPFDENLFELKRLLFFLSARHVLVS